MRVATSANHKLSPPSERPLANMRFLELVVQLFQVGDGGEFGHGHLVLLFDPSGDGLCCPHHFFVLPFEFDGFTVGGDQLQGPSFGPSEGLLQGKGWGRNEPTSPACGSGGGGPRDNWWGSQAATAACSCGSFGGTPRFLGRGTRFGGTPRVLAGPPPPCGGGSSLSFDLLASSGSSFGSHTLMSQQARRHLSASVKAFVYMTAHIREDTS